MQGLFRREMEPPATGQSFWMAVENQRLTSSGVSVLVIVQVLYCTCTKHLSMPLFGRQNKQVPTAPLVRHAPYAKTRMDMEAEIG